MTVGGRKWERLQFQRIIEGQTLRYTMWLTILGRNAVQVTGWTPSSTQAAHDAVIEPVFLGFKLTP